MSSPYASHDGSDPDAPRGPLVGAPLPILFQDDDLVVVSKPPDMTVHREARARRGERHALQTVSRQIDRYLYPVHRLDRNTSGVLAFALSSEMAAALQANLTAPEARKEYLTLVRRETPGAFVCDRPLTSARGEKQAAESRFERLAFFFRCSLLRARILTGRRHQIRRHLAHRAHQVIGDGNYGKGRINRFFREEHGLPRMVLHATRLEVAHPRTGEPVVVHDPLPDDLRTFLTGLPECDPGVIDAL